MPGSETRISRVTRPKEQARDFYNRLSRFYGVIGRSEKKFREFGLELLKAGEGEKVLEIGFGAGTCLMALAHSIGRTGKVYGIDISEGMIAVSRSKIKKARLSEKVVLILGDSTNLVFDANMFDAVFTSFTLELFDTPEIPVVLHECHRVLKPGGRICVVALSKSEIPGWAERLYERAHVKFPKYADCRPIRVKESLEEAGFEIQGVRKESMWRLPVEIVLAGKYRQRL